jgi:hypothetical protein
LKQRRVTVDDKPARGRRVQRNRQARASDRKRTERDGATGNLAQVRATGCILLPREEHYFLNGGRGAGVLHRNPLQSVGNRCGETGSGLHQFRRPSDHLKGVVHLVRDAGQQASNGGRTIER